MRLFNTANKRIEKTEQATKLCLEYILESELDDFFENPSDTHVYYLAQLAMFGEEIAKRSLVEAEEYERDNK